MSLRTRWDDFAAAARGIALMGVEKLETGIVFNPTTPSLRSDPYPLYAKLRQVDPFHRCRNADGWVLTRYADVLDVLREPAFSADERNHRRFQQFVRRFERLGLPDPYADDRGSMLRMDPPTHTRLRGLVAKAFTPRAVERMRPRIEAILKELLESRPAHGPMELVTELAAPLPVRVIAEMLGVPPEDHVRFRDWSNELVRSLGEATPEDHRAAMRAGDQLDRYFEAIIEARRRAPKDDLISALVAAEDAGDRLKRNEMLSTLTLLLIAGNETTTNLISNATLALLRNPDQLEILRREPERIPDAIEELLRYDSPVQMTSRIASRDLELRGREIQKGSQLVLLLGAANRDPEVFAEPDRLDVTRRDVRHVSFSHGIHFCLGAQLARLEAGLALQGLITRFPSFKLLPQDIPWRTNTILRGPQKLWLEL
ncbi:MAG TPA: cytochrome P450 [Myxococcota bacterium]|nr:cytochrome P450 [Myxococcota bacterium]